MKISHPYLIDLNLNASSLDKVMLIIPGIIAEIVLTKKIFKKNEELSEFTTEILDKDYKKYLFLSRTSLYARIIKDLIQEQNSNPEKLLEKTRLILDFFAEKEQPEAPIEQVPKITKKNNSQPSSKKTKKTKDTINDWREVINPKKGGF